MRKTRLSRQIYVIYAIIIIAFLGSALFFAYLNTDSIKKSVKTEMELSSQILTTAISTSLSKEGKVTAQTAGEGSDLSDSTLHRELRQLLSGQEQASLQDNGTEDISIWVTDREGNVVFSETDEDQQELYQLITSEEWETIYSEEDGGAPVFLWIGPRSVFRLRQSLLMVRKMPTDNLYLVIHNSCKSVSALQRSQFSVFAGIELVLMLAMIVLLGNTFYNYRRQLIQMATTDELTGLANRKSFLNTYSEYIEGPVAGAVKHPGQGEVFSLFLIDIDFFKQINDGYGHASGDLALRTLASHIREMVKRKNGFAGRWGGDEFIGVLPCGGPEAEETLNELCRKVREEDLGGSFRITISVGTAQVQESKEITHLSELADQALYVSKENGRDRVTLFDPERMAAGCTLPGTEAATAKTETTVSETETSDAAIDVAAAEAGASTPGIETITEKAGATVAGTDVAVAEKAAAAVETETTAAGTELPAEGTETTAVESEKQSLWERLQYYLHHQLVDSILLGVKWMAPFVAGGGLLIGLAFLFDTMSIDLSTLSVAERTGLGSLTPIAAALKSIGDSTFNFMLPVFAGFMAYGIAGEAAFMAGFVGGFMTIQCNAGFIGAMIAGLAAGIIANEVQQFTSRMPAFVQKIAPIVIFPIFNLLLMQVIATAVISPISGALGRVFTGVLDRLVEENAALAGGFAGAMMATDMGGIINKVAYNYAVRGLQSGQTAFMASVMAGGMVPPIGIAISMLAFPKKYSPAEKERLPGTLFMGLSFITEGALPFVFTDVKRTILSCMAGSALAGLLSGLLGCTLPAPHGGIFVLPVMGRPILYLLAILCGSALTAVILGRWKKSPGKGQD